MLTGFEKIVEERIRQAQKKGEFDKLPGSGKPLEFEDDSYIMGELRLAYKILKNGDCIPLEIELKKEINRMEDLLFKMDDTAEKYRTIKKLNFLVMKLNSLRNTSITHEIPQRYMSDVIERIGSKP
jgi:DnaJ homologue, subfamily C, member 28, conserved domain